MKILAEVFSFLLLPFCFLYLPIFVSAECPTLCNGDEETNSSSNDKTKALMFKLIAILSILISSAVGISLPIFTKKIPSLRPESNLFFLIKSLAAGVILATGFVHILPDAFDKLTNPCLKENPWKFPFAGFIAMLSAILTMMIEAFSSSYYKSLQSNNDLPAIDGAAEMMQEEGGHTHVHTHGHPHGTAFVSSDDSRAPDLFRHRIISQVLEVGIVVHSVIIGISLGTSQSTDTIRPLVAALTFHQFFEGMGLGGYISQAKFKSRAIVVMVLFFCLTTPMGIAIGIRISKIYDENSPTELIVEGIFNSLSAGILIYMALVDFLAEDFMNPKMQANLRLQLGAYLSLLLGIGLMSLLAKWA